MIAAGVPLIKALEIMASAGGLFIVPNRVTVSTVVTLCVDVSPQPATTRPAANSTLPTPIP